MIALSALTEAFAMYIQKKTGIPAYTQRISTAVYPMYSISAMPRETTLMAGGTQLLRHIDISVACYPSRQRQEAESLDMADKLLSVILVGLPLCSRHFSPFDCKCLEKEQVLTLEFSLEFCDLPAEETEYSPVTETMQNLSLLLSSNNKT